MAPPLAASSSEDEEVDKQVEEEQKGSTMKKPNSGPKTSHSFSSSDDDDDNEVDKQVEEEQKGSTMKKPNSGPKTSHSFSSSSDDDDNEEEEEDESDDSEPATVPIASKPKKDALKPSSSELKTPSNNKDDDETPPPKPKPIVSKVSSNVKKHPLVSQKDSKLKKKKQKRKVLDANEDEQEKEESEKKKKKQKKKVLDTNEGEQEKEESEKKKKKKQKKKVLDTNEGEQEKEESEKKKKKNVIIQRLWSDHDEIVLLKGLLQNKNNGGFDPLYNLKEFLESIKKSLQFQEVKLDQLKNKIKRLRKKFVNSSKRAKGDKDPVFSKHHEQISYTLMKDIWGVGGENFVDVADGEDVDGDFVVDDVVKKGDDLEPKWRCLIVDQLKLYLRRVELVREQTVAILDAHKSLDASEVHE